MQKKYFFILLFFISIQSKLLRRKRKHKSYRNLLTTLTHLSNTEAGRRKLYKDNAFIGFFVQNEHRDQLTKQIIEAKDKLKREQDRAEQKKGYFEEDFNSYKTFVDEKVTQIQSILSNVEKAVEKVERENIQNEHREDN